MLCRGCRGGPTGSPGTRCLGALAGALFVVVGELGGWGACWLGMGCAAVLASGLSGGRPSGGVGLCRAYARLQSGGCGMESGRRPADPGRGSAVLGATVCSGRVWGLWRQGDATGSEGGERDTGWVREMMAMRATGRHVPRERPPSPQGQQGPFSDRVRPPGQGQLR